MDINSKIKLIQKDEKDYYLGLENLDEVSKNLLQVDEPLYRIQTSVSKEIYSASALMSTINRMQSYILKPLIIWTMLLCFPCAILYMYTPTKIVPLLEINTFVYILTGMFILLFGYFVLTELKVYLKLAYLKLYIKKTSKDYFKCKSIEKERWQKSFTDDVKFIG
jgi:hypothetical protein